MTHHGGRTLDREDLRILTRLSEFAAAALQVLSALDAAHRQIAEHRRIEDVLEARVRQQAAVAELGRRALTGIDLGALMDEAAAIVASGLMVEYSNIFELLPDGTNLLLRAGTGWADGLVGQATLSAEGYAPASHALLLREPVIMDDLRTETRFRDSVLLRAHGVISGVSTVIQGQARPMALWVHSLPRNAGSHRMMFISFKPWPICWPWPSTASGMSRPSGSGT